MSVWRFIDPGADGEPVETIISDAEIIATFYPWWAEQMTKVGRADLISHEACIDDYVVVHWAERVDAA